MPVWSTSCIFTKKNKGWIRNQVQDTSGKTAMGIKAVYTYRHGQRWGWGCTSSAHRLFWDKGDTQEGAETGRLLCSTLKEATELGRIFRLTLKKVMRPFCENWILVTWRKGTPWSLKLRDWERVWVGVLAKLSPLGHTTCPFRLPGTAQSSAGCGNTAYPRLEPWKFPTLCSFPFACFSLVGQCVTGP